ncbi:MAG: adenylate/guanylate cyclase domain-containing protein [Pseudolabrys sp.]
MHLSLPRSPARPQKSFSSSEKAGWRAINPYTLRFDGAAQEIAYREARRPAEIRYMRAVLVLVFVFTVLAIPLDLLLFPRTDRPLMYLGHGVEIAVIGTLFGISFVPYFRDRHMAVMAMLAVFFASIYAVWNVLFAAPDIYVAGGILVIVAIYILLPFDFVTGTAAGVGCSVLYLAIIRIAHPMHSLPFLTLSFFIAIGNAIGGVSLYHIERLRRLDFANLREIDAQRGRYRDLLVRILPQSIADRLQQGESGLADRFDEVTVLFADLVGFTSTSARHGPEQVVAFLDRVFASFDALVEKYGVEKIKTIGDAYMVASGVPATRPDHAAAVANLALDMLAAVQSVKPLDGEVQLRIGISSGPVVAGVIGDKRFGYDLWGDTVNVASRMESFGVPGRIQVSEQTFLLLKDRYEFAARGEIEVKGRGAMPTWYLLGGKSVGRSPHANAAIG